MAGTRCIVGGWSDRSIYPMLRFQPQRQDQLLAQMRLILVADEAATL